MDGIAFTQRNFGGPAVVPGVKMTVERLEWRAAGGPWAARVRCTSSSLARLWGLADLLRCGMTISDEAAGRGTYLPPKAAEDLAWWGYVSGVEIRAGVRWVKISLDGMFNRVAVRYRPAGPLKQNADPLYTSFAADSESVRMYGEKEKIFTLAAANAGDANAYAAAMLKELSKPKVKAGAAGQADGGDVCAILEGRGWWETLGWRYYSQPRGKVENLYSGTVQPLGSASANSRIGYTFSPGAAGWAASEVWLYMKKSGAADSVTVELCENNSGTPGAVLAAKTINSAYISDSLTWTQFVLTSTANLSAGTSYWIVIRRTGSVNAGAYYEVAVDESLHGAGTFRLYNGSSWTGRSPDADLTFMVLGVEESTKQIAAMLGAGAGGQFLTGVKVTADSGLNARLHRDGSRNARVEVEELLRLGQAGGKRLLGRVDAGRRALITAVPPESSADVSIGEDGRIEHLDGRPLALSEQPAGRWARLGRLSTAGALMGYAGAVFIENVYWDGTALRYGG